jgi:hypothetical protein
MFVDRKCVTDVRQMFVDRKVCDWCSTNVCR